MKRLPIGVENFKTMIDKDFYYVDSVDTFGIRQEAR